MTPTFIGGFVAAIRRDVRVQTIRFKGVPFGAALKFLSIYWVEDLPPYATVTAAAN